MAYSEDAADSLSIRKWVKDNYPNYVFISSKEIHGDCAIFNPETGHILCGRIKGQITRNKDLLKIITDPKFKPNKKKGFGLTDPGLLITLIGRAERAIYYYSNHGKEDHKAQDYLRAWELELQELRGEA